MKRVRTLRLIVDALMVVAAVVLFARWSGLTGRVRAALQSPSTAGRGSVAVAGLSSSASYAMPNSVMAGGVSTATMQSASYQLVGTLGEMGLPNNTTTITSAHYRHQPGFLASVPPRFFPCDEPANNSHAGACGPLMPGYTYHDYILDATDADDYFYVDSTGPGDIEAWLSNLCRTCDFNLYLYDDALHQVDYSGNTGATSEHVLASVPGGHYYVRVERRSGQSSTQPYALRVDYRAIPVSINQRLSLPVIVRGG